jgi:serine/threonine protein kinase
MQKRQIKDYILDEEIGKGMYSKVYLCHRESTKEQYACKKFTRSKMSRITLKNLSEEIRILSSLPKSDNIIALHDVIKT